MRMILLVATDKLAILRLDELFESVDAVGTVGLGVDTDAVFWGSGGFVRSQSKSITSFLITTEVATDSTGLCSLIEFGTSVEVSKKIEGRLHSYVARQLLKCNS